MGDWRVHLESWWESEVGGKPVVVVDRRKGAKKIYCGSEELKSVEWICRGFNFPESSQRKGGDLRLRWW